MSIRSKPSTASLTPRSTRQIKSIPRVNSTSEDVGNLNWLRFTLEQAPAAPAAPTLLGAIAAAHNQINLSWTDNANNETGFRIERKAGANGAWQEITTVGANVLTYQNTGLSASTQYYFRVRAYNGVSNSNYTNEANATTSTAPVVPPAAPTNLGLIVISSTQINLAWSDNAGNETGFKIERKTGTGGAWQEITTVGSNVTTYQNTGLSASTQYTYRVRATNTAGDSAYSNEPAAMTSAAPSGQSPFLGSPFVIGNTRSRSKRKISTTAAQASPGMTTTAVTTAGNTGLTSASTSKPPPIPAADRTSVGSGRANGLNTPSTSHRPAPTPSTRAGPIPAPAAHSISKSMA